MYYSISFWIPTNVSYCFRVLVSLTLSASSNAFRGVLEYVIEFRTYASFNPASSMLNCLIYAPIYCFRPSATCHVQFRFGIFTTLIIFPVRYRCDNPWILNKFRRIQTFAPHRSSSTNRLPTLFTHLTVQAPLKTFPKCLQRFKIVQSTSLNRHSE